MCVCVCVCVCVCARLCVQSHLQCFSWQVHGEAARGLHYMCAWVIEAEAVLIKVNPATGGERSMRAYWSRPLGCGECLAGKDSLVRRLTLIHWTLIRMALPGLDASVITVFVSRSPPSPILPPSFFIIVVRVEQFRQTSRAICLEGKKGLKDVAWIYNVCFSCCVYFSLFIEYIPPSRISAHILFIRPHTHTHTHTHAQNHMYLLSQCMKLAR